MWLSLEISVRFLSSYLSLASGDFEPLEIFGCGSSCRSAAFFYARDAQPTGRSIAVALWVATSIRWLRAVASATIVTQSLHQRNPDISLRHEVIGAPSPRLKKTCTIVSAFHRFPPVFFRTSHWGMILCRNTDTVRRTPPDPRLILHLA